MSTSVSIIVPCFNQAHFLNELLYNVDAAVSSPYELIIIDDGSTDGVMDKVAKSLTPVSKNQSLTVIRQANKGLSGTRNVGLKKSKGQFIQFLDSDDLLVPSKIDTQIALLEQHGCDICIDDYMLCDEKKSNLNNPPSNTIGDYELCFEDIAQYWEREMSIPIHCALFRKQVIEEVQFDEELAGKEDWVFWLNVFAKDPSCIHHKEVGAIYRQHANSMTKDSSLKMGIMWLLAVSKNARNHPDRFTAEFINGALKHFQSYYSRKFWLLHGPQFPERLYNSALSNFKTNPTP